MHARQVPLPARGLPRGERSLIWLDETVLDIEYMVQVVWHGILDRLQQFMFVLRPHAMLVRSPFLLMSDPSEASSW